MNCPYLTCRALIADSSATRCGSCSRFWKACDNCKRKNLAFANFCTSCGQLLSQEGNWATFRGDDQRLGLNRARLEVPFGSLQLKRKKFGESPTLSLSKPCSALLIWDQHVLAISEEGQLLGFDIAEEEGTPTLGFSVEGHISAEPCVARGTLFVAGQSEVSAYSLGTASASSEMRNLRWGAALDGTPIHALLVFGDRLFVTLQMPNGRRALKVIEGLFGPRPSPARALYLSEKISYLAADSADPERGQVIFLSEDSGEIRVNRVSRDNKVVSRDLGRVGPLAEQIPIAVMGTKIFAVLGDSDSLFRVDLEHGLGNQLRNDVKKFTVNRYDQWTTVDSEGIVFPSGSRDDLHFREQVRAQPITFQNCGAALGLQDGRIRVYDLQRPPYYLSERLEGGGEAEITAMASVGRFLVAGDALGRIGRFELAE